MSEQNKKIVLQFIDAMGKSDSAAAAQRGTTPQSLETRVPWTSLSACAVGFLRSSAVRACALPGCGTHASCMADDRREIVRTRLFCLQPFVMSPQADPCERPLRIGNRNRTTSRWC